MKVIINEGGLTCSTLNPVKKPDRRKMGGLNQHPGLQYILKMIKWEKAESERQTFEIENQIEWPTFFDLDMGRFIYEPGTTHEAEIVNGKAVIK